MPNNVISLVHKDMERHKAVVVLPGEREEETLYLFLVRAKTSKLEDFCLTYGDQVTSTHLKLAKKVFGEEETESTYGVFYDPERRPIFAFNRGFANYDRKRRAVVYRDVDDVLMEKVEVKKTTGVLDFPDIELPEAPHFPQGSDMVLRYSLVEAV